MRHTRKQFLSDSPEESGLIVITASSPRVEDIQECTWYEKGGVECQVQIGDCSQKIYLNFNIEKESDVKKRIDKLNVLIDNLTELKEMLPVLWADAKVNAEEYKKLELIKERENEDEKSVG